MVGRAGRKLKKSVARLFGAAKQKLAQRAATKALERMDPIAREFVEMPTPRVNPYALPERPAEQPSAADLAAVAYLDRVAYAAGRAAVTTPSEARQTQRSPSL